MVTDWEAWHAPYDDPGSALQQRLEVVRDHIRGALDAMAPGPVRAVSVCAGQGRDLLGVLADHPRRGDVTARLVELDRRNAEAARSAVGALGLTGVEVRQGDASSTTAYEGAVPAELVLVCGVFGNVADGDIRATVEALPMLCAPGAVAIWTRFPRDPELLPTIDGWFGGAGFERVALVTGDEAQPFGVGVHRLVADPPPYRPGVRLFTFLDQPDPAGLRR